MNIHLFGREGSGLELAPSSQSKEGDVFVRLITESQRGKSELRRESTYVDALLFQPGKDRLGASRNGSVLTFQDQSHGTSFGSIDGECVSWK